MHSFLSGFDGLEGTVVVGLVCFLERVLTARTTMIFIGHIYLVVHRLHAGLTLPPSDRERILSSHNSLDKDAYEIHSVDVDAENQSAGWIRFS